VKRNISIFFAVIGVFAGRAVSRWGNSELQLIVFSLAFLGILLFGLYIYKKNHNYFLPLGCVLLVTCLPLLEVLQDSIKSSEVTFFCVSNGVIFLLCFAVACMITGAHQIAPQDISHKQWKYWMMALAGFWLVCCGGAAALTFL